ncbi:4Fe-4S binding protein [Nonomuraea sp. NPDC049504]|uniref:4Fe-4S binding protein n=1 Tax=Nonomuraea sp. NPDC049504 TaxID=3154729 RepID=UPI0034195732
MLRKSVTQQYPEVKPDLPPRSRGVIALVEENCTSCMLCARECPDWCIYIDSHKETIPAPEGGRARQRNVLDRFAIDFSLCMYCGICIEVCPFDALFWSPEFEYAEGDIRNLLHEKDKLSTWVQTVPPPPAHDPGAELPKELTAARRPPRPAAPKRDQPPAAKRTPTPEKAPTPSRDEETTAASGPDQGTMAASGPDQGTTPASDAGLTQGATPAEQGPTAGPSRPGGRPRRAMTNVRGIRPPGALPSKDEPSAGPAPQPQEAKGTPAANQQPAPQDQQPAPRDQQPAPRDQQPAPQDEQTAPQDEQTAPQENPAQKDREGPSSTGEPPPGELSTAEGEPPPKPDQQGQTSAASRRRRRMADPRSIRPPGRLGPDESEESEEES